MNNNWYKILMKANKIEVGKDVVLRGMPVIFNKKGAKLEIGQGTIIKSNFLSNLVGLYSRTIIVTRCKNAYIKIGKNVGISGATIYARKGIYIGDNTCIGGNCKILDNDFHPIDANKRNELMRNPNGGDDNTYVKSKEIFIGEDCFIGCTTIILKGTRLGNRCIVGAGAVVSGEFPDDSVIVGNPGKVIKKVD